MSLERAQAIGGTEPRAGAIVRGQARPLRVTYFSLSFPELTQTFVFNEMRGLKRLGADIDVVALAAPKGEMSDLPAAYGFGERIRYVAAGGRTPGAARRAGQALAGAARLAIAGHGRGVYRLARGRGAVPMPRSQSLRLAAGFLQARPPADVVMCHFGPAGRVVARLKRAGLISGRLVVVFHGYDLTQYLGGQPTRIYDELFEAADLMVTISDLWRDRLVELGAPPARVETLRLGIDCAGFAFRPKRMPEAGPIRLISVGRLVEKKGHAYAVATLAELRARRPDRDFELDIVGDGPLGPALEAQIEAEGLGARVRLHGGLDHRQVRELLEAAHVFVLHSVTAHDGDMEGIPVSIMEAMAMGLPVVATRHSGIPELIEDGLSGLLVEERDVEAMAGAIETLIDAPGTAAAMSRNARARIEQHHNSELQSRRLFDRLGRLVGGGATPG
jgi:colanic acid/amylovoran biosynthesis glycosyltransferase